ncbi:thiol oxidoreductase, partial [Myxococcota bacterium]|nr:thiol oxidoreductase [Myxococcota bacterium]
ACHLRDGRGVVPNPGNLMISMLFKVGTEAGGGVASAPDPIYGSEIQVDGVGRGPAPGFLCDGESEYEGALEDGCGAIGEAFPFVEYEEVEGFYQDGRRFTLRKPIYGVRDPSYGELDEGVVFSPRIAPPVIGLGLLGAIPDERLQELADPDDQDGDGISGRLRYVEGALPGPLEIGRYGYKSGTSTVLQQSVEAFLLDTGITTSFEPNQNCTALQESCLAAAEEQSAENNDEVEFSDLKVAFVELYTRTLAVPLRRGFDPDTELWSDEIWRGRENFFDMGCVSCHVPRHTTGVAQGSDLGTIEGSNNLVLPSSPIDALTGQVIWPYTDLLLHDMGGSCEDISREDAGGNACESGPGCFWIQRCDGLADPLKEAADVLASEWKTPPLWGVGLTKVVTPTATFLHDGRARSLEEAILWHGGEAQAARDAFIALPLAARLDLIAFLESM